MKLFAPLNLKNLVLRNRVVMPAMVVNHGSPEGFAGDRVVDYYAKRAEGGVGFIVVEATVVRDVRSGAALKLCDDRFMPGLRRVASAIHQGGAVAGIQLFHFLRVSRSGWYERPGDMSVTDIRQLVADFASAAVRARKAGFDAVELHMAHGYTLASFLSLAGNNRNDEYGRTMEGRLRLPTEVYQATRAAVGEDFVVGSRINGDDFVLGGNTLKQSVVVGKHLDSLGIDYLSVSAGGRPEDGPFFSGYSGTRTVPTKTMPDGVNVYLTAEIRKAVRAPVIVAGKIRRPEHAEKILCDGGADLIGIGRQLLADPEWTKKVLDGRRKEIRQCSSCAKCWELARALQRAYCLTWEQRDAALATRC